MTGGIRAAEKDWQPEWQEVFVRLCERFPTVKPDRVKDTLRDAEGHAGNTAAILREMSSSNVKAPDPDDIEHVSTLLSSPAMFKHACKEQFKEFDADGNGVLDVGEVIQLTRNLYSNFGLQEPSEGSVRAFFTAMDENNDGVLSEREFRRFFEMFLRFAFFDVAKLRQLVEKGQSKAAGASTDSIEVGKPAPPPKHEAKSPAEEAEPREKQERQERRKSDGESHRSHKHREPEEKEGHRSHKHRDSSDADRSHKHRDRDQERHDDGGSKSHRKSRSRHSEGGAGAGAFGGGALRCVAPNGVAYRKSADYSDRGSNVCASGDRIQVLEHWVRTPDGWLPLVDSQERALFQVDEGDKRVRIKDEEQRPPRTPIRGELGLARSEPPSDALIEGEEDWKDRWDRLAERFPHVPKEKILQVLRDNGGHAGMVANMLRDM